MDVCLNGENIHEESYINEYGEKYSLMALIYNVLCQLTKINPPWGTLYGVRPVHLYKMLLKDYGLNSALKILREQYLVSEEKIHLLSEVSRNNDKIVILPVKNSFSLYIAIPFCPSRCNYCSFVSHSIEKAKSLTDDYTNLLVKEIAEIAHIAKNLKLKLETIYFGGGTPTSLNERQLKNIFDSVAANFDLSSVREYTVEAGRPDTINPEKLIIMKEAGVSRISINPQTFNDEVLNNIGRRHTSRETEEAYLMARDLGFDNINMDFIAALPSDNLDSYKKSIIKGVNLGAPSITVHALALKSGSYLNSEHLEENLSMGELASQMISFSNDYLKHEGYIPYYLYRQSKSAGNLENVGWCKSGYEGIYNIFMIEETNTVLSAGAGGVTLLKNPITSKIERIYNYKYPYEYINQFDEIIKRKKGIMDFYTSAGI